MTGREWGGREEGRKVTREWGGREGTHPVGVQANDDKAAVLSALLQEIHMANM